MKCRLCIGVVKACLDDLPDEVATAQNDQLFSAGTRPDAAYTGNAIQVRQVEYRKVRD